MPASTDFIRTPVVLTASCAALATAWATDHWWVLPLGAALYFVDLGAQRLPAGLDAAHREMGEQLHYERLCFRLP